MSTSNDDRLTVDQMFARYHPAEVEKAIVYRDYPGQRDALIQKRKEMMAEGFNVEGCQKSIQWAMENMPNTRPFDPDEPQHLHPDVLWRIQFLKYMYPDTSDLHESELASIHAVLDAYRTEKLQVDLEKVMVWFGGNMVMGPMSREELDVEILNMPVDEWRERLGPGMVWIEEGLTLNQILGENSAFHAE